MNGALRYLCLAAKAGGLVVGTEQCQRAVRRGRHGLLVLAADAQSNARAEAEALAGRPRMELLETTYTKSELGGAVGRGRPVALALMTNQSLAAAFSAASAMEHKEDQHDEQLDQISRP